MPKDKRKKKYLQGMEHLKSVVPEQTQENAIETSQQNNEGLGVVSDITEHSVLKKELITSLVIMTFLFLVLAVFMYIDRSSSILLELAENFTSFFVK